MRSTVRLRFWLALALVPAAAPAFGLSLIAEHQDIEGPFDNGPAVTETCLACHEDAAHDFMKTAHWTWLPDQNVVGKGDLPLGKRNTINNFCIAVDSNWPRCTSCHAGYGWQDASFDFEKPGNIDCLVCHDQTGEYRKFPTGAGHPVYEPQEWEGKIWEPLDLASLARSVGLPERKNCGICHFYGGGGNNVKHGDLEEALLSPPRELDVHMSPEGQDFTCQECHTTRAHVIAGNAMFDSPGGKHHLECTSCHEEDLHPKRILNWHTKTVACQTCHIPLFARQAPTTVWWDWSTAGSGQQAAVDSLGMRLFDDKKGTFRWAKDVMPSYAWYNGRAGQYTLGNTIEPDGVTHLNWLQGNRLDPRAKIYPFKVMRGRQPYDKDARILVVPKLYGEGGLWSNGYDWKAAIARGMEAVGLSFSGKYGFAETSAYWKINHMVAPAEQALKCVACHAPDGHGRLDWTELGYSGDPAKQRGVSRYELKSAYQDVNQD